MPFASNYLNMENEPDYTNVSFIDEYPALEEKLRIKRLMTAKRIGVKSVAHIVYLPTTVDKRNDPC